jgi:lipopolysaccharide biosynthesis glycosyltransferase
LVSQHGALLTELPASSPTPSRPAEGLLEVVFALHDRDGAYWMNTAVAISSVLHHTSGPVRVNMLHDHTLTQEAVTRLSTLFQKTPHHLRLINVQLPDGILGVNFGQFSVASVYRLLIPRLFADKDAVLYLDSDLVASGLDIFELYSAPPSDVPLSGVIDPFISEFESHRTSLQLLGLDPVRYVNSGVLMFRPKLIPEDLIEAFSRFNSRFGRSTHPDQDFINFHFQNRIGYLNSRFNFQISSNAGTMFLPLMEYHNKILHYAGTVKPLELRLAPGLLPFWQYTADIPEIFLRYSTAKFSYLHPAPEGTQGLIARPIYRNPSG